MIWRRKRRLGADLRDWIADNFFWAIETSADWAKTPLILPTREFFTAPKGEGHEVASAVLEDLKRLMGLSGHQIALHPLPSLPDELSHEYGKLSQVAGTYAHDADLPEITYDPKLLRSPITFISVMAHELMHHCLAGCEDDLPGGAGAHELATDLHCIIAGFGVFQLQCAEEMGWSGYMTQDSRAHALALFLLLTETDPETACAHLSPRPAKALRLALREVQRNPAPLQPLQQALGTR